MHPDLFKHGRFSWTELMTTDVAAAQAFYGELFGWTFKADPMPTGMTYHEILAGGESVGGMMACDDATGPQKPPPCWGTYVTVDDVDAVAAKVTELGGAVHIPPTDIPGTGRFTVIQDPQGAVIMAITYAFEEPQD